MSATDVSNLYFYGGLTNFSFDWGNVPVGSDADNDFTAQTQSVGIPPDVNIGAISVPAGWSIVSAPSVIAGGGGTGTFVIRFHPTAPGPVSGDIVISSDAFNQPNTIHVSGNGSNAGHLTLNPATSTDFGNVKDGTPSGEQLMMASNNSGADVTVTAINFNGDFTAGPTQPGLPFTLLANGASSPVAIGVIFTPSATGFQVQANGLSVVNTGDTSPALLSLSGTGVIIIPVFPVDINPQAVLMAFVLMGVVVIKQMNAQDLDCEESASLKRIYDWGAPLMEKYLGRVILRYEDESATPFDFTVTARAPRVPSPVTVNVLNEGGANDSLIHNVFADLQISDDMVEIEVSRGVDDGPMVVTEMFHEVDRRGEVVEKA